MKAMTRKRQERLIQEASALLAEYLRTNRTRTDLLKDIAAVIVELRSRHTLEDGRPDWSGRSPDYRKAIADVYARAEVPSELADTVQAALRYHVGNLLRERAADEDLTNVGLSTISPRERLQRNRDVVNAVAAVVEGPRGDLARLAAYAEALLEAADDTDETLSALDAERRDAARIALRHIDAHSIRLLDRLDETDETQNPT